MKPCPACGKSNQDVSLECTFCSIVFKKWENRSNQTSNVEKIPTSTIFIPTSAIKIIVLVFILALPAWFMFGVLKGCQKGIERGTANDGFMHGAIQTGNIKGVQMALQNGILKNSIGYGHEFLIWSVEQDKVEIFKTLLEAGAKSKGIIHGGKSVWTALVDLKNQAKINMYLSELAKHDPDLTTEFYEEVTPIQLFAQDGFDINPLIQMGADVHATNRFGHTLLYYAKLGHNEANIEKVKTMGIMEDRTTPSH